MDGDIKRRESSHAKRPTQKSSTLSRKAALAQHSAHKNIKSESVKAAGKISKKNPFEPPKDYRKKRKPKKKQPAKKHDRHVLVGLFAIGLFGLCMALLGYSLANDRPTALTVDNGQPANVSDLPQCEVSWVAGSPADSPEFELTFDRELSSSFRALFIVREKGVEGLEVIKPQAGRYKLTVDGPKELNITVIQDSDVATDDVLCEYGPVLAGYGANEPF